jgi:hypothetical protein
VVSFQLKRGNGRNRFNVRPQVVPSFLDYESQKVKRRRTTAHLPPKRRTHRYAAADDARGEDEDAFATQWSFNNDDATNNTRKNTTSYWDNIRPEVWAEFISTAGVF